MRQACSLIWLVVLAALACDDPAGEPPAPKAHASALYGSDFGAIWHDGKAELAGYDLRLSRYGEPRRGTAVMITVTEPFRLEPRVKAERPGGERFDVLKMNLVEDFQTGIYDYNLMTSAFIAIEAVAGRPAGAPTKVSFSSQEWCGHVYAQAIFDASALTLDSHSYFEGEADEVRTLAAEEHGISEDALLLWARGLSAPAVGKGETATVPMLRSLSLVRLRHVPPAWDRVVLRRHEQIETVATPLGSFEVRRATARVQRAGQTESDKPELPTTWTFFVETADPGRVVKWTRDDGTTAELRGATRLAYWQLNGEGGEAYLDQILP